MINIMAGWLARAIVIVLSFINTRLLLDQIGISGLAAYSIIYSLTTWLVLLNLGIPISVQNLISRLRGQGHEYQEQRNYAYGSMILVMLTLFPFAILIALFSYEYLLDDYSIVSKTSLILVCLFIYISGQFQLLIQVLYAEHESFWPNIYPAFTSVYTCIILIAANILSISNFNILIIILGLGSLIIPVHTCIKLDFFRKIKFSYAETLKLINESKSIFIFSIFSAGTLAIDYGIMALILAPTDIVNYNLVNRLFSVLLVVHGVILASNWSPIADLLNAKAITESRKKIRTILKQGLLIGTTLGVIILLLSDSIVNVWSGGKINHVPMTLGIFCWIYAMLRIWTDTYSMALLAHNKAHLLNYCIPIQACISIIGQFALGTFFGPTGIIAGLALSFLLTVAWFLPLIFHKTIKN
jgi:O-antigen/teichoic acid export membrane protein